MKKKSGFTMVELLVAIAITMVALAAAVLAFRDSTRANANVTQNADMSDNPTQSTQLGATSADGSTGPRRR